MGNSKSKSPEAHGKCKRPVWLDCRVPGGEMMGDGIGKESNDCLGFMNATLRVFAFLTQTNRRLWGRGLGRRVVWLELTAVILQTPNLIYFSLPTKNFESRKGEEEQSKASLKDRQPGLLTPARPSDQARSPPQAPRQTPCLPWPKEADLEPGQDLQTSNL